MKKITLLLKKTGISAKEMEQRFLAQGMACIVSTPEYTPPAKKTILDKVSQIQEEIKRPIFDYNVYHETETTSNFIEKTYYYGMSAGWIEASEIDKKLKYLYDLKERREKEITGLEIAYNDAPKIRWLKRSNQKMWIDTTYGCKEITEKQIAEWEATERKTFRHNETIVNWYLDVYYYE
jgi:hypothetical protein